MSRSRAPRRTRDRDHGGTGSTTAIRVVRTGDGPEVLLVHGGASPSTTWIGLESLASRWTLAYVHRRGYPPSPPGRHDFDVDADDLEPLLASRPHLVAHSYGTLGTLMAAARRPDRVHSLTLIEPPLFHLAPSDPDVSHLERIGNTVLRDGLEADPAVLREFLHLTGAQGIHDGPLPDAVTRAVRRAHGGRLPSEETAPPLEPLREARIPTLVASGGHSAALERICDALADELGAKRIIVPGAGHFVPAAPGFAEHLHRFLSSTP